MLSLATFDPLHAMADQQGHVQQHDARDGTAQENTSHGSRHLGRRPAVVGGDLLPPRVGEFLVVQGQVGHDGRYKGVDF